MPAQEICPFCNPTAERLILQSSLALALHDGYPVSPGHTLIVPKRHIPSLFDATEAESADMLHLLAIARSELVSSHRPAGFNIGVNDGQAAGQTVMHLHIHLIPRYAGDREDPRGGVRWIFPEKADYWSGR
jgi:diadenosine tetraphosphate (Ap4A) HIT family hydrolase